VFNPVDKDMFVTDHGANTVSVIDSNSQTVIATITVGSNPHAAAFDFTNAEMYISNEGSNTVSAISISHPTPGVWTTETPRPVSAEGLGATEIGNTIFAIGGGPFPNVCHNDAYDTAANSWSTRSPMPVCVAEPSGVVSVAGLVYVISGGCQISTPTCPGGVPGGFPPTSAVQIYNPKTDKWSMGAPIPTPRLRGGAAVYNGKIFVIGGHNAAPVPALNVVEVYDTLTNTWTTAAPMPTGREGLLVAIAGDKIFAIGGFTVSRTSSSATNVVEEYNVVTNTWTTGLAPMPTPRGAAYDNGGVACGNQPIFVIGGETAAGPTNVNEAYIPALNQWIARPPMPTARGESGTGIVGSQLFVIGGSLAGEGLPDTNANEAFQCSNTLVGMVDSGGIGTSGVTVIVSEGAIPMATGLTAADGFYHIDLPAGGTYTVSATTLIGTATATVSVLQGTITIQNLTT
jgi:YVTN family beta-propeller protein